jgi:signal transduction histidine kinase
LASTLLVSEHTKIGRDSLNPQVLKSETERINKDFELMNLKVFSPSGEVLYSGNPHEVGETNQNKYFHDVVAKGQVYAKVVPKDEESLEGKRVARDVLETYVPLMDNGEFLGAFEVYYDITDRKKHLDTLLWQSSTIVVAFASALLAAIFFILYRENLAIEKRRQLEEERLHTERLEGVVEMAGAACHEFGQPLQTLVGYSHLLIKHLPKDSPMFGDIEEIKKSIAELGSVVHKITHITRYETKEYIEGAKIIDIDKASS